ncbi:MAG: hypothetical protein M3457_16245 [Chloroflexota bacterium]|nr:hypothetical protein [Chloroflexota bacterium]
MILDHCDARLTGLLHHYIGLLELPVDSLKVTTSRVTYRSWIGRTVPSAYGGAYCFLRRTGEHAVLINLDRIDQEQPRAVEIVVAEELIHMRDRIDGDTRRHAHHGYDRIAHRVAALTRASLDEIRSALKPVARRPLKYLYQCPGCGLTVGRRRKGTWSCARCSPRFDRRYQMRIVEEIHAAADGK